MRTLSSLSLLTLMVSALTLTASAETVDYSPFACRLLEKRPDWERAMNRTEARWGLTPDAQLALISAEWSLEDRNIPAKWRPSWSLPGRKQPGITPGYFDATWERYKYETGAAKAEVSRFSDFSDFMGWYASSTTQITNVMSGDAASFYILWRRGPQYYRSGIWRTDTGMIAQSQKFAYQAQQISDDLAYCAASVSAASAGEERSVIVKTASRPWKWIRTRAGQVPWLK